MWALIRIMWALIRMIWALIRVIQALIRIIIHVPSSSQALLVSTCHSEDHDQPSGSSTSSRVSFFFCLPSSSMNSSPCYRGGEERRGEGRKGEERRGEGRKGEERRGEKRRGEERGGEGREHQRRRETRNTRNTICRTCTRTVHACQFLQRIT